MNYRRKLIIAIGAGALGVSSMPLAQTQKVHRVGILLAGSTVTTEGISREIEQELRRLGYVVGQNVSILVRNADGQLGRFPMMVADLLAERVDVIIASGTLPTQVASKATSTIPIVFVNVTDPVASGFVQSLARPGYNLTGISHLNVDLSAKRLEILKELFPKTSRVAVLVSDESNVPPQTEQVEIGAVRLGISTRMVRVRRREEFDDARKQLRAWRANALFVPDSSTNSYNANMLMELATQLRLPAMYARDRYTDAGGLASYGPNSATMYRRTAYFVDKILKGAKPADLPVELPTHYELVFNMKTAKTLGLMTPHSILQRADRVIE